MRDYALQLGTKLPEGDGVGLLHAYSGTCSIDIDYFKEAMAWLAERGVNVQQLIDAADSVLIDSGNPGHAKLLYQTWFPLPNKKVIQEVEGKKVAIFEFRCATHDGLSTQCVLPPSRHPLGRNYQWAGNGNWQQLPQLPVELLNIWNDLLEADNRRNIPTGQKDTLPTSWNEVVSALNAINPDIDREHWIKIGMGVHMAAVAVGDIESGFDAWHSWSSRGRKYKGLNDVWGQWKSFTAKEEGITVATVFYYAKEAGWTRPPPSMEGLFSAVIPEKPPMPPVEEVRNILSPRLPVPKCNLSNWPDVLVRRAKEVAAEVGCDAVVPLVAGLCAISGAADARSKLVINPTWKVPPTIWAMTIGEPADKKTPGSKPMFAPLHMLEIEDKQRFETELLIWQGMEARHAAQVKNYREWSSSSEAGLPNAIPPVVEGIPKAPASLRIVINDATTQKVVLMSESRPKGFLLHLDEMNRWLTKLSDQRTTDDRGVWIQGFETGPYTADRVGAGTTSVENFALSIYGNCQPEVFRENIKGTSADGISQRFLTVPLNSEKNAMWQQALPDFMSCAKEYENLIRRTHAIPQFNYEFSPDGLELFRGFCKKMLVLRDAERVLSQSTVYQMALGKMDGTCARIIFLFHLIEDPYTPFVSAETVRKGMAVILDFFYPMLRYTYMEIGQQRDRLGDVIFDYLIQVAGKQPYVTSGELRRVGKHYYAEKTRFDADNTLMAVMDELCSLGAAMIFEDRTRNKIWTVNPNLATIYEERRKKIEIAKNHLQNFKNHGRELPKEDFENHDWIEEHQEPWPIKPR